MPTPQWRGRPERSEIPKVQPYAWSQAIAPNPQNVTSELTDIENVTSELTENVMSELTDIEIFA